MSKKVLFFAPYGSFKVHHQLDLVVGTALRFRNCDVLALLCDGFFPSCDVLGWSGENAARDCSVCHMTSEALFASLDFPREFLKSLVTDEDRALAAALVDKIPAEQYADAIIGTLELGKWVTSSIFSYFRIGFDSLHLPHIRRVHRQFLINGILTWSALDKIVAKFSPTHLFVFNGRFAPYRIALEYGKRHNIPVITHERGYIDDTFFLFRDFGSIESKPFFDCITQWKDIPLSAESIAMVKKNFLDREHGKGSNYTPFINYTTDVASVRAQLRIPQNAKIVSVFTSSEYELAYCDDFKTEISQTEALQRLCDIFKDREEYLVIRHHPYIGGTPSSPPDVRFLAQIHKMSLDLPSNVRVILPSEKLSTYALFGVSSAAISFLSTAGIEAIIRGIPTASFPQSYYRDAMTEIMTDISKEGIANTIDRLISCDGLVETENLTRAYRTYHAIIGRLSQKFKTFGIQNIFEPDIRISTVQDILPGNDPALDRVCDHVISGTSLIPLPSIEDKTLFQVEEKQNISQEHANLSRQKDRISNLESQQAPSQLPVLLVTLVSSKSPPCTNWPNRSRHQNLISHSLKLEDSFQSLIKPLSEVISAEAPEYVLITADSVTIGEGGISSLIDALEDPGHQSCIGARLAGWVVDAKGVPNAGVFSERDPVTSIDALANNRQIIRSPHVALSFFLFRRLAILELLKNWELMKSNEGIIAHLIDLTSKNAITPLSLQTVLIPNTTEPESVEMSS